MDYGYEVQARENDRHRRNGKVWDTVLSNYGKHEFNEKSMWTLVIRVGNRKRFLASAGWFR